MSRTDNTMPWRFQKADNPLVTPTRYGGAYARVGEDCRWYEKRARQRARAALQQGEEPEPARHRGSARYDYY